MENFKKFLENMPQGILDAEKKEAAGLGVGDEKKIIEFAKAAYPRIYAYMKIFDGCCRVKEEIGIHKFIKDENICSRFDKFLREGGDIEKIRQGKVDEEYLSSADLEVFREAEREMHKVVAEETRTEIKGAKKAEFDNYIKEGEEKLQKVEEKMAVLRHMAAESPEWGNEILDKISELEERWINFGNEPQVIDVDELLEYYSSVINVE